MIVLWMAFAVVLAFFIIHLLFIVPTKWLKLERITWTRNPNTKIVQISDLHIERNRVTDKIVRVIAQEQPDYIFLTGDYLDSLKAMPKLQRFLERMAFYRIPTYAVLGNHDYLLDAITPLTELMNENGIHVLRNETVALPEFDLVGIDDFCTEHSDIHQAFHNTQAYAPEKGSVQAGAHPSAAQPPGRDDWDRRDHRDHTDSWLENRRSRFVITHDPTVVLSIEYTYDALISGHLHGKQFNVPFLFVLQPMGPLAAQGIYQGVHSTPHGDYYISKGAGQSGHNARLFVRSEITLHFF